MNLEQHLNNIEANALALRNMADTVLAQVGRLRNAAQLPATERKSKKIDRRAKLTARLLSGKGKPNYK